MGKETIMMAAVMFVVVIIALYVYANYIATPSA